jgi:hypothetical protein
MYRTDNIASPRACGDQTAEGRKNIVRYVAHL